MCVCVCVPGWSVCRLDAIGVDPDVDVDVVSMSMPETLLFFLFWRNLRFVCSVVHRFLLFVSRFFSPSPHRHRSVGLSDRSGQSCGGCVLPRHSTAFPFTSATVSTTSSTTTPFSPTMTTATDRLVIRTADDALLAKEATVRAGYYDDAFLLPLAEQSWGGGISSGGGKQFQPIIKRGTHARVGCIDRVVTEFLSGGKEAEQTQWQGEEQEEGQEGKGTDGGRQRVLQVVVLGAGKDTGFFRQVSQRSKRPREGQQQQQQAQSQPAVLWIEVDFPPVMQRKFTTLQSAPVYRQRRASMTSSGSGVSSNESTFIQKAQHDWPEASDWQHWLVGHDLRATPGQLLEKLKQCKLQTDQPVLFVVECVQMYMPHTAVGGLWRSVVSSCAKATVVLYEPILLHGDRFGQVMEQHMLRANVVKGDSCLVQVRTLEQQLQALLDCGFSHATGCSMYEAYHTILTTEQRQRAANAEFLDEVEEWKMIMEHYCLVVATTTDKAATTTGGIGMDLCRVGSDGLVGFHPSHSMSVVKDGHGP